MLFPGEQVQITLIKVTRAAVAQIGFARRGDVADTVSCSPGNSVLRAGRYMDSTPSSKSKFAES